MTFLSLITLLLFYNEYAKYHSPTVGKQVNGIFKLNFNILHEIRILFYNLEYI